MKQLLQDFSTGRVEWMEVPPPALAPRCVLVQTHFSVVSAGTERSTVDLGRKSLFAKALARPDLVRQVLAKARSEGFVQTLQKVQTRLESYKALGYSSAGVVVDAGTEVSEFKPGDRVACAGAEYAHHAEVVAVPANLCVRAPDALPLDQAAFGTLGAIALQAIRQAELAVGESVAVIGLGLIGQLVVQLAKAAGCRVFGVDLKCYNVERALAGGADRAFLRGDAGLLSHASEFTSGCGFDAVILTASGPSNDPVELAAEVARDRARVVVVGDLGLSVPRAPFYFKELDLRLSRSYGPGRYDPRYEILGHDYPQGYVRWTAKRNLDAFLQLAAEGKLRLEGLVSHQFAVAEAALAYDLLLQPNGENCLGILLRYATDEQPTQPKRVPSGPPRIARKPSPASRGASTAVRLGVIGAGNYCQGVLLPVLRKLPGVELRGVATATSAKARNALDRFGFDYCTCEPQEILSDPHTNAVVIATRHDTHAALAAQAIRAGKCVFVEKPLALTREELEDVAAAVSDANGGARLIVGFNRRFAPVAREVRECLARQQGPWTIQYRVNAGQLPKDHWLLLPPVGGGRLLGEACHFVDFVQFLTGARPLSVQAHPAGGSRVDGGFHLSLRLADGSFAGILYAVDGDPSCPKERVEVIGGGLVAAIDDFRCGSLYANGRTRRLGGTRQDKGQSRQMQVFAECILSGEPFPMPFEEIYWATLATLQAQTSLQTGVNIEL